MFSHKLKESFPYTNKKFHFIGFTDAVMKWCSRSEKPVFIQEPYYLLTNAARVH